MSKEMTAEQIIHWRTVLFSMIGIYANIMSVEEIMAYRDNLERACEDRGKNKNKKPKEIFGEGLNITLNNKKEHKNGKEN